ncbi:MAG: serine/threonine protein kinase [Ignavibacteriales bacterium]|nr:MAG: serine/threonine protein kinase [Ignavibacteriales bacterium]
MDNNSINQLKVLFEQLVELPAEKRESFLDEHCKDNLELRRELLSLLKSYERGNDFLEVPTIELSADEKEIHNPFIGKHIGPYLIESEIGLGGMGIVYAGIRDDKEFEQKVAIKIIKHGFTSEYFLKRFQRERQTLANLKHHNIARLLDGGRSSDGLPYLVMEFIDGIPITDYCVENNLTIKQKLVLFRLVCDAVQYAHRNLVIHRDIKPGNILVDKEGSPKLLDFGIAKLLDEDFVNTEQNLTQTGTWLLTPEYASPEQIKGEEISTLSDVYSLGVIFYQILTGEQPYKATNNSPAAISKIISEGKFILPSELVKKTKPEVTYINEVQKEINSKPLKKGSKLSHYLKGDLDNIVLKAMHKDISRRYSSVEQFSEDIRRHLTGLPVIAQKDTAVYRLSKFIQRHKVGFVSSIVFFLFMIASIVAIAWQSNIAGEERDNAEIEADKFERVNRFLQNMFSSVSPDEIGRDVKVYDVLEKASENVETELKDKPEIESAIRRTLGKTYTNLGEYNLAKVHLEKALHLNENVYGKESENVAVNLYDLGLYYHWIGELKIADSLYNKSLSIFKKTLNEPIRDLALTLNGCALLKSDLGNFSGAVIQFEEALEILEIKFGRNDEDYASITNNLAIATHELNDLDKAEKYYLEAQKIFIELLGEKRTEVASTYNNLAFIYLDKNDFQRAEKNFTKSYNLKLELKGEDHPDIGLAINNLGAVKFKLKNYKEAKELYTKANIHLKKTLPYNHAWVANSYFWLGKTLLEMKDYKNAEINLRHSLKIREKIFPKGNFLIYIVEGELGISLLFQKKISEAEILLLEGYEGLKSIKGAKDAGTIRFLEHLIKLYEAASNKEKVNFYKNLPKESFK